MSTHDYVIDNALTPTFRSDLNSALAAIVSNNSSTSAPTITYENMWWYDTTNDTLKIRNESNSGWISLGFIDQTSSTFTPNQGFIPVRQGGISGTGNNLIYLGWNTNASGILVQVDSGGYLGRMVVNPTTSSTSSPTLLYAPGEAPIYACRAWVNFNGTGTVAIRASGNVTSITDNGAGNYSVNFTTAMIDTNYATVFSHDKSVINASNQWSWHEVVSSSQVKLYIHQGLPIDATTVTASIFR